MIIYILYFKSMKRRFFRTATIITRVLGAFHKGDDVYWQCRLKNVETNDERLQSMFYLEARRKIKRQISDGYDLPEFAIAPLLITIDNQ